MFLLAVHHSSLSTMSTKITNSATADVGEQKVELGGLMPVTCNRMRGSCGSGGLPLQPHQASAGPRCLTRIGQGIGYEHQGLPIVACDEKSCMFGCQVSCSFSCPIPFRAVWTKRCHILLLTAHWEIHRGSCIVKRNCR